MAQLTIDNQAIDVAAGSTILAAARGHGVDIPTLCYLEGYRPNTSCMVCVVRLGNGKIVPSCATRVEEGMVVETRGAQVDAARRTALELLLSDHAGDCLAPCTRVCPAHMDIPLMIRQIGAGELRAAIATIKAEIALPAVLGFICPAPCEKGCRRLHAGGSLSVCMLKRHAAEADLLAAPDSYRPACAAPTGRRVAVVGSGPAGLSAAYYLARRGHGVTIFDEHEQAGGALRYALGEERLPRAVLDAEIAQVGRLGVGFELGVRVGRQVTLEELRKRYDAVLLAIGPVGDGAGDPLGLRGPRGMLAVDSQFAMAQAGLFAAGGAVRPGRLAVRSGAEGKSAAEAIARYLQVPPVPSPAESGRMDAGPPVGAPAALSVGHKPFTVTLAQLAPAELAAMMQGRAGEARHEPAGGKAGGLSVAEVAQEVERCLHCDCRKVGDCTLRALAERYGADPHRYGSQRPAVTIIRQRAGVIFEPGKCIDCGLCVQVAAKLGEKVGLTFVGRGFAMRPGVPFHGSWDEALARAAEACVRACPTGAIAWGDGSSAPGGAEKV